jgi:hypothetical protein
MTDKLAELFDDDLAARQLYRAAPQLARRRSGKRTRLN